VPAQWLWVQVHGYFISGLALVGIFLAGSLAGRIASRGRTGEGGVLTPRLVSGAAALAAMLAIGVANPNGYEIYLFPFVVVGTKLFMRTVFEWTPTFTTDLVRALPMFEGFCLWLALLFAGGLDSPSLLRRHRQARILGGAGLALLAILHPRLAPPGLPAGMALEGSLWASSPSRFLVTALGIPDAESAIGPLATAIETLATFGVLWIALLCLWVVSWRKPATAAVPIVAAVVLFGLRGAGEYALPIAIVVIGASLFHAVYRRSMPVWQAVAVLTFLALAVRQNRNIANFTLVTLPVLAASLTRLRAALADVETLDARSRKERRIEEHRLRPGATGWAAILGVALLALSAYATTSGWPYAPNYSKQPGLGVDRRFPEGAVRYVRENGLSGRVFNTYYNGAYLIHELYPETRVLVDSRMDVYGSERLETYDRALADPVAAGRIITAYRIDYAIIDYTFPPTGERDQGIFAYLGSQPDWALVYFDDSAAVYVHDRPERAGLIARDRYRLVDPTRYAPGTIARLEPGALEGYAGEVERALLRAPGSSVARLMKCEVLASRKREAEALFLVDAVLRDDPRNAYACIVGARLARRSGERERSLGYYRRAIRLLPGVAELRREMQSG
jgi:hypothetical protein